MTGLGRLHRAFALMLTLSLLLATGGRLDLAWFSTCGAVPARAESMTIFVTASGLTPDIVTVYEGTAITWVNQTDQPLTVTGGTPFRVFLPDASRGSRL